MQLLQSMHRCMQVVRPPAGSSQWDVVKQHVERLVGASWPESDLICFYNFCKVVGPTQLTFLADMVTLFVDVDRVTVRPTDFQAVSRMHPTLVWIKIMFLAMQYLSQDDKLLPGPHGKAFGAQLAKADFDRFVKMPVEKLKPVEAFVAQVLLTYTTATLPDVSSETLARELPAFLVRTGKQLVLWKENETPCIDCGKLEQKLRELLKSNNLPPSVAKTSPRSDGGSCSKPPKGPRQIQPDATPALQFDATGVIHDEIAVARGRGLVVGANVTCLSDLRGIKAGALGTVTAVETAGILVRWQSGSRLDGTNVCEEIRMTVNSVGLAAAEAPPGKPKKPEAAKPIVLPDGIAWVTRKAADARAAIHALVHAHLYQLYITHSPTAAMLRVTETQPRRLVVTASVAAGRLILLPWVHAFEKAPVTRRHFAVAVKMTSAKADEQEQLWLAEPTPLECTDISEAGETLVCCPFWHAFQVEHSGDNCVQLQLKHGEWTVPIGGAVSRDPALKTPKQERASLVMRVPFLTNAAAVDAGSTIWAAA